MRLTDPALTRRFFGGLGPSGIIFCHVLIWWVAQIIAKPALDSYGDMVEVYAWSQHWLLGSDKHPQFLPWMAKLWFAVMPRGVESFYALSAVNLAVALLGVDALSRAVGLDRDGRMVAIGLTVLGFPYLTLAGKLNMNAILLAVWPWMAHAFFRMVQAEGRGRLIWAGWLGLISALGMMGKYYTAVLLLTIFLITVLPRYRFLWRGAAPWVFLAVFVIGMAPHLGWLIHHRQALGYVTEQGAFDGKHLVGFLLSPLAYWPLSIAMLLGYIYRGPVVRRLCAGFGPDWGDALWWFAAGPLLITAALGLTGVAELSMPWAIPIGFAYGPLWARRRAVYQGRTDRGIGPLFLWLWPVMITLAVGLAGYEARRGVPRYATPEAEMAQAIIAGAPAPLQWVASGDGVANDAARVGFFAPAPPPEALPDLPDRIRPTYPARMGWRQESGVALCPSGADCVRRVQDWANTYGFLATPAQLTVARHGWRFPAPVPMTWDVVYLTPLR